MNIPSGRGTLKRFAELKDRRITCVRHPNDDECVELGLDDFPACRWYLLELDDDSFIVIFADPEGNGPGYLEHMK